MARLAIRMPKMSMTMTEGEVASWMVKVGDEVAVGDVVCEVMTDKVDMEVESTRRRHPGRDRRRERHGRRR